MLNVPNSVRENFVPTARTDAKKLTSFRELGSLNKTVASSNAGSNNITK